MRRRCATSTSARTSSSAPDDLLRQAVGAEQAGFDGIGCSDHLQPWWEGGESGNAWVWLGAAAQATEQALFGTGVTPPGPRYHPALIAQAWATMELMYPGRPYLGFGSGEALNEAPLGQGWPAVGAQIERMEEALEMIRALWDGQKLSGAGEHFAADGAFIHSLARGPSATDLRLRFRPEGGGSRRPAG